jgi:hypothetical protein
MLKKGKLDMSDLLDIYETEQESFDRLATIYQGYKAFDTSSEKEARELFGEQGQKTYGLVRRGRFQSQILGRSDIDRWFKDQAKGKKREELTQLREYRKALLGLVGELPDTP